MAAHPKMLAKLLVKVATMVLMGSLIRIRLVSIKFMFRQNAMLMGTQSAQERFVIFLVH